MNLPASFLLGIVFVLLHETFVERLPGDHDWLAFASCAPLFLLPWLVARLVLRRTHAILSLRVMPSRFDALWLRVPGLLVPIVYGVCVFAGDLIQVTAHLAGGSEFAHHALLLAPLLLSEVAVRLQERPTVRLVEAWGIYAGSGAAAALGPLRLPMLGFVAMPILTFSLLADVAFASRRLEVFFSGTALGNTVGILVAALVLCFALPLFFRFTLPVSRRLPSSVDAELRRTARALEFREADILVLHTNLRMVNAAMVGPLPWPRYLVLTDAILVLLDRFALMGVVAHEIGHARHRHPALLLTVFLLIPVLLMQPLLSIDWSTLDTLYLSVGGTLALLGGFVLARKIAHRFEHEADEASALALGGAEACIRALQRVGELYPGHRHKSSFRHPSELRRVEHLQRWSNEPGYRALQARRGRWLRLSIAAATLSALAASVFAHARALPFDRAVYALYTGDFAEAGRRIENLAADPPISTSADLALLLDEARAAVELVGPGGPGQWSTLAPPLGERAWTRALAELRDRGPSAARPWVGIAVSAAPSDPLRRSAYEFLQSIEEGDAARSALYRRHLETFDLPAELAAVLATTQ